ncbi:MAG: right-handed parallel beta-helix repeat-containing protein, partial [Bacteroidota bacterium]
GGIQIGSGSERVRILENTVIGGHGNGITLGHFSSFGTGNDVDDEIDFSEILSQTSDFGSIDVGVISEAVYAALAQDFMGVLYEIEIEGNVIRDMGFAGIGVLSFFNNGDDDGFVIHVDNLAIYRNTIQNCAQEIPEDVPAGNTSVYGGIVLASVEHGRIEENRVEDCGRSHIEPVCGIYVQNGEELVISRNRVLNNGPRTTLTDENFGLQAAARRGVRGGIVVGMSIRRQIVVGIVDELNSDGIPAAQIHDNIVVQPLGQALRLQAFGPVSVVGNSFMSHELDFGDVWSLIAGAVMIFNLGVSKDMIRLVTEPTFLDLATTQPSTGAPVNDPGGGIIANPVQAALILLLLQYLPSGQTLFANNQVTLDMRNLEIDLGLSATLVVSLDDIGFTDNQCEVKGLWIPTGQSQAPVIPLDILLFDTVLAAPSVRTHGNRFQEGFTFTLYSLLSLGILNSTTGNQSTNCLFTFGVREVFRDNIEGFAITLDCARLDFGTQILGDQQSIMYLTDDQLALDQNG